MTAIAITVLDELCLRAYQRHIDYLGRQGRELALASIEDWRAACDAAQETPRAAQ